MNTLTEHVCKGEVKIQTCKYCAVEQVSNICKVKKKKEQCLLYLNVSLLRLLERQEN